MSSIELPKFIKDGTFSWGALDYHFHDAAPTEINLPNALQSSDPWIVLLTILEQAKLGNHEPIYGLERLIRMKNQNPLVTNIAIELLGTAGTSDQLKLLENIITHSEEHISVEACGAASCAGDLTLVPAMLSAWKRSKSFRQRETISLRLGLLLEEWDGPVTTMEIPVNYSYSNSNEEAPTLDIMENPLKYVRIVESSIASIRNRCTREDSPVILGQSFGVIGLAEYMLALLKSNIDSLTLGSMFLFLRHRFDSSTGIDCSSFFNNRKFQPLAAAAIIEEFLEGHEVERFEHEVRYFFGHKIPN